MHSMTDHSVGSGRVLRSGPGLRDELAKASHRRGLDPGGVVVREVAEEHTSIAIGGLDRIGAGVCHHSMMPDGAARGQVQ